MDTLLEKIAKGAPLPDILYGVVETIEDQLVDVVCSISLIEFTQRKRLCLKMAPSLPAELKQFIDGILAGEEISPCSKAAGLGKIVIADDISKYIFSQG